MIESLIDIQHSAT